MEENKNYAPKCATSNNVIVNGNYLQYVENYYQAAPPKPKTQEPETEKNGNPDDEEISELTRELLPAFINNVKRAKEFIRAVDGQTPKAIAEVVNRLVKEEVILRAWRKSDLWKILNKYGIYRASLSNWNDQVN